MQAVVNLAALPTLKEVTAVTARKYATSMQNWRLKHKGLAGRHTMPYMFLYDLCNQLESVPEAHQIMEAIVQPILAVNTEDTVTEGMLARVLEEFIKATDQRCRLATSNAWHKIAMTGQTTPCELAANIMSMVDAIQHQQPVDQHSLIKKFRLAIPKSHAAVHARMTEYMHQGIRPGAHTPWHFGGSTICLHQRGRGSNIAAVIGLPVPPVARTLKAAGEPTVSSGIHLAEQRGSANSPTSKKESAAPIT